MFTLPFLSFFLIRDYALSTSGIETQNTYSVAGAVITANIVIASYVYSAFSEPDPEMDAAVLARKAGIKTD